MDKKRPDRIFHTWDKWECYPAGFYENKAPDGMSKEEAESLYYELLSDIKEFKNILSEIIEEWPNSCEHYLTNDKMNRIAWMGQAALCKKYMIPSKYRGGYHLLDLNGKEMADTAALEYINKWMVTSGYDEYTLEEIGSRTQANIY